MSPLDRKDIIAQWAFDTRPILLRFHLWLEDVEVERSQPEPVSAHTFAPRGIARCIAMTSAATALGTKLFGQFGEGAGKDKFSYNQVKKSADAISAYSMSEGLWYLTRSLPENHAIMVCLGEGLMPKSGETPEMGANPLLGFGRVYARPEVAQAVDEEIHRLLNDPDHRWNQFYEALRRRGITVWGAAVDTLENTSRFAEGQPTGPMTVFHLFDAPLTVTRPYEAYFGCLTVPKRVADTAQQRSVLLDWVTPRSTVMDLILSTYTGILPRNVHVWTLAGKSRHERLGSLWEEWRSLGAHLVDETWTAPTGLQVFTDSGTYAPTFLVRSWQENGEPHVFLCDGYAATAEAMQAASLSEVLDVDASMTVLSPTFTQPIHQEYQLMNQLATAENIRNVVHKHLGGADSPDEVISLYEDAIREAREAHIPLGRRSLRASDLMPEKEWSVLACSAYMCDDPYTGNPGVERLSDDRYRVTTRLDTRRASSRIRFTFRLKDGLEESRLVFSPLLVRFMSGIDWRQRPVKISDSGRIRNELQTLISQALDYDGPKMTVCFSRIDEKIVPKDKQAIIRDVLLWYKDQHPVWFNWLDLRE
ncbi:MAG: hypothetical protein HUU55_11275 [Myxococcales bacterium]|nr:hypothetical protein [Myxococcales bacterium]